MPVNFIMSCLPGFSMSPRGNNDPSPLNNSLNQVYGAEQVIARGHRRTAVVDLRPVGLWVLNQGL